MSEAVSVGSVVISDAGRDKGRAFVAVSAHDGRVYIADGKAHRLCRPKAKNPKHISPAGELISVDGLTDKKLRVLLSALRPKLQKTEIDTVL